LHSIKLKTYLTPITEQRKHSYEQCGCDMRNQKGGL